jgi:hypothetical protein
MLTFSEPTPVSAPTLDHRPAATVDAAAPLPTARRRVLAITSNLAQASSRLRVATLVEPLARRGIHLDVRACPRTWAARRDLLRSAAHYDAVLLQRKLLDPWNWRVLRRHARRVLFDVDDAVRFHAGRVGPYSHLRTALRFAATARNVDHVVAGNDYLAAMFRDRGCGVTVVPTGIDATRYRLKHHAPPADGAPRLVWIGSRSTLRYLDRFMPALSMPPGACRGCGS